MYYLSCIDAGVHKDINAGGAVARASPFMTFHCVACRGSWAHIIISSSPQVGGRVLELAIHYITLHFTSLHFLTQVGGRMLELVGDNDHTNLDVPEFQLDECPYVARNACARGVPIATSRPIMPPSPHDTGHRPIDPFPPLPATDHSSFDRSRHLFDRSIDRRSFRGRGRPRRAPESVRPVSPHRRPTARAAAPPRRTRYTSRSLPQL